MYCGECGKPGAGKYCTHCGTCLREAPLIKPDSRPSDWRNEHRYSVVVSIPEVQSRIARSAAKSKRRITAEEFLKLGDELTKAAGGVPIGKLGYAIREFTTSLGVKMERQGEILLQEPIGAVLAAVLSVLAEESLTLRWVEEREDGCDIDSTIPSGLFSLDGDFSLQLRRHPRGTFLRATTKVAGQFYDLGNSQRFISHFLKSVQQHSKESPPILRSTSTPEAA